MKRLRFILGAVIILITVGIVVALFISSQKLKEAEKEQKETTEEVSGPPSIEADKLKYTESEGGKTIYEIESDEAKFFKDESRTELKNIRVTFFYQDQYKIVVVGDRGELNTDTKNITISSNVSITAAGDYKLTTDNLTYSADRAEITTDDPIFVTGPAATFEGKGLVFNLGKEELSIKSDVKTDIIGEGKAPSGAVETTDETGFTDMKGIDSPVHISASSFSGSRKENVFRYTGGVVAVYKEATLTASIISIYLSGDMGKIKTIEADGAVRLVQNDIKGSAGKMVLDYDKKLLTLTKNPVIWRGEDMVKGDKILYYIDEKKSVALGGTDRAHLTIYPKEEF
jgi:lipopolysaccharide export system protein LptA